MITKAVSVVQDFCAIVLDHSVSSVFHTKISDPQVDHTCLHKLKAVCLNHNITDKHINQCVTAVNEHIWSGVCLCSSLKEDLSFTQSLVS